MRNHKATVLLVIVTLAAVVVTAATAQFGPANLAQSAPGDSGQRRRAELKRRYPVTDFESPEPANPEDRVRRKLKNKRYDKFGFAVRDPSNRVDEESFVSDWALHLPAVPADRSAAVVVGEVLNSAAHLSNDRNGIYSEFSVRVDDVIKGAGLGMAQGSLIVVDRAGGSVRYPNGHQRLYRVEGQNMPRVTGRYVLFLTTSEEGQNYHLLTGYELLDGKVSPLDESSRMSIYDGTTEESFLRTVRETVLQASQPTTRE